MWYTLHMEKRRRFERFCAPLGFELNPVELGPTDAFTHDLSRTGVKMVTVLSPGVGNELRVQILVDGDTKANLEEHITREGKDDTQGKWKYEIAVEFEELLPENVLRHIRDESAKFVR
jgi:hypothetical protein